MTKTKTKTIRPKKKLKKLDRNSTSASIIIDAHYAKLGLQKLWNENRVNRLCSYLRMTHSELASLLHMTGHVFKRQIESVKPFSGPVCLLLTILEHQYMGDYAPDTISNIFKFTDHD